MKTTDDGIPILDNTSSERYGSKQMGNIQLLCSDKFAGCIDVPKLSHISKTQENKDDSDVNSLSRAIIYKR